jgi:thioredoxin 1
VATITANKDNFNDLIVKNGIVLVDFWAEWCGPCKAFAPVFETASTKHKDICFAKVDTDDQQELAQAFEIRSIPTLMIFREQVLLFAQAGALPGDALEEIISQVKALDMEAVRKEIAEQDKDEKAAEPAAR